MGKGNLRSSAWTIMDVPNESSQEDKGPWVAWTGEQGEGTERMRGRITWRVWWDPG